MWEMTLLQTNGHLCDIPTVLYPSFSLATRKTLMHQHLWNEPLFGEIWRVCRQYPYYILSKSS